MKEIHKVRQIPGVARRRWFTSTTMDLIVWFDQDQAPIEFQLCYDKGRTERAIGWSENNGFTHMTVDSGEQVGLGHKGTPILLASATVDIAIVRALFAVQGQQLPKDVVEFIEMKFQEAVV